MITTGDKVVKIILDCSLCGLGTCWDNYIPYCHLHRIQINQDIKKDRQLSQSSVFFDCN